MPAATRLTVDPETVQVLFVCELKLTGKPEEAVAERVCESPTLPPPVAVMLPIVWVFPFTRNILLTIGAAA